MKMTALYERISREDRNEGESFSILRQKEYLETYAAANGFENCRHYTDDGFSGRNFERPGWQQMMTDIDGGKIGTVLVKDMSRVGRDYLQTGFYTEIYFKEKDVRFIAIDSHVAVSYTHLDVYKRQVLVQRPNSYPNPKILLPACFSGRQT